MKIVFYLRGLNTQGDDQLRFGRLAFGPMHAHWIRELEMRDILAVPVLGRGGGPLNEQIERAQNFVSNHTLFQSRADEVIFLGHSTGGLVARALAQSLHKADRRHKVITIATPHHGSHLAEAAQTIPSNKPLLHRALQLIQYDIEKKILPFRDLEPQSVAQFNQRYKNWDSILYKSAVFSVAKEDLSWPFRFIQSALPISDWSMANDGMVTIQSQSWGDVFFQNSLEHTSQIGYHFQAHPKARRSAQIEFRNLVDAVASLIKSD